MIDALCSGLGTLKYLVASSLSEACNNSVLLLRPRGCGKAAIRLNGMLHSDDNCATKASSDDNTEFMIDMLRCGAMMRKIDTEDRHQWHLMYGPVGSVESHKEEEVWFIKHLHQSGRAWERPKLMFDLKQTGSFLH
uniref:Uncharacterized protein n=1 Tax=Oryza glumipatula TaxID=40148 RepID=A0A0E0BLD0_9ORYZ